jgi:hypothetical protein
LADCTFVVAVIADRFQNPNHLIVQELFVQIEFIGAVLSKKLGDAE